MRLNLGRGLFQSALVGGALVCAQVAAGTAFAASGKVAVHLSNRSAHGPACKASNVDHVYVTISDVRAHRNGNGGGFQSLIGTPTPAQFDLMFASDESTEPIGSADCPIVGLGGTGLLPGKYEQLRLITVDNGTPGPVIPANENACASLGDTVYNCVDAGGQLAPLTIPSGSKTGLKIPPGQVGHGGLKIADGQSVDLDIDIDACRELVVHGGNGNGKGKKKGGGGNTSYSLKPTLHSGEIALNPVISGQVVVGTDTGARTTVTPGQVAVPNANVWLETEASQNVTDGTPTPSTEQVPTNTLVAEATTDSSGNFVFCPVPVGNYDIVVDAESLPNAANPADATITTGVTVAANNGVGGITIPVIEGSGASPNVSPQVTTQNTAASGDDIDFFGTQGFEANNRLNQAEIPPYSGTAAEPVTTSSSGCPSTCPVGTNCVCFDLFMPPDNPVTGAVGGSYTSGSGTANYSLLSNANKIGTSTPECSPAQLISLPGASPLALPTLSFTNCD